MLDEEPPSGGVDHGVQSAGVQSQRVVVVEAVDVHLGQADLVVGVHGGRVEQVTGARGDEVWVGANTGQRSGLFDFRLV